MIYSHRSLLPAALQASTTRQGRGRIYVARFPTPAAARAVRRAGEGSAKEGDFNLQRQHYACRRRIKRRERRERRDGGRGREQGAWRRPCSLTPCHP